MKMACNLECPPMKVKIIQIQIQIQIYYIKYREDININTYSITKIGKQKSSD